MINESKLGKKKYFEFKMFYIQKTDTHYLNKSDMDYKTLKKAVYKLLKICKI